MWKYSRMDEVVAWCCELFWCRRFQFWSLPVKKNNRPSIRHCMERCRLWPGIAKEYYSNRHRPDSNLWLKCSYELNQYDRTESATLLECFTAKFSINLFCFHKQHFCIPFFFLFLMPVNIDCVIEKQKSGGVKKKSEYHNRFRKLKPNSASV